MRTQARDKGGALIIIGKASIIGLHMVSGVLVGGFMGWMLDSWLKTGPWLLCLFFLFGVVAGFLNVWRDIQSIMREQDAIDGKKMLIHTSSRTARTTPLRRSHRVHKRTQGPLA